MKRPIAKRHMPVLNVLASWINELPFWASIDTVHLFQRIQKGELLLHAVDQELLTQIESLLKLSLDSLLPQHQSLIQAIQQWRHQFNAYYGHRAIRERKDNPLRSQQLPPLAQQWKQVVQSIHRFKTQIIQKYNSSGSKLDSRLQQQLGRHFKSAQKLQRALNRNLQQHNHTIFVEAPSAFETCLIREAALDLIFLAALIKPSYLVQALNNQKELLALTYLKQQAQLKTVLQQHGLPHYMALIREQRMLMAAQQWQHQITQVWPTQWQSLSGTQRAFAIHRLLRHQKTHLLKQHFATQKGYQLFQACYKQSLHTVQQNHQILQQHIQQQETQLLALDNWSQTIMLQMGLVVRQQPAFHYGQLAALYSFDLLDHYPQLGRAVPKPFANQVAELNGISFLWIHILLSSWWGSSYQLTNAITQLLFFNETVLSYLGRGIESIAGRTLSPIFDWSLKHLPTTYQKPLLFAKQQSRFDRLGLTEKAPLLLFLMGLMTHTLMCYLWTNQDPFVSAMTYCIATSFAQTAVWMMDQTAVFPDSTHPSRALTQAALFSVAYRYSFSSLHSWLKTPPTTGLSHTDALKRFGLSGQANATQIKKRFRQLSLQHHPDKCFTLVCRDQASQDMMALTEAYDVLMKP